MWRNKFTHFVRKVFAHQSLPTGKLRLFRALGDSFSKNSPVQPFTWSLSINRSITTVYLCWPIVIPFIHISGKLKFVGRIRRRKVFRRGKSIKLSNGISPRRQMPVCEQPEINCYWCWTGANLNFFIIKNVFYQTEIKRLVGRRLNIIRIYMDRQTF